MDAGSCGEPDGMDAAGANGRSLLVRVPFAERGLVVDPPAAGEAVFALEAVDRDECAFVAGAVLDGVLAGAGSAAPALPESALPESALPEPDRVDPDLVGPAPVGAAVRFLADVEGFVVGFSALMEQRYAVTFARRESDQLPPTPGAGARRTLAGPIPQPP